MKNIIFDPQKISLSGVFESPCYARGKIDGKFYIGSYSYIAVTSRLLNTFVGRYSRIDDGCETGISITKEDNFSNHYFAVGDNGPFKDDEYYQSIKISRYFYEKEKFTFIGNDVHIHKDVKIYSGCSIGDGAIILANSVVLDDVPPYTIVAGNPARVIKKRFSDSEFESMVAASCWWDKDISNLCNSRVNLIGNRDFLEQLALERKNKKIDRYYFNSSMKQPVLMEHINCIAGPSHIHIWQKAVLDKKLDPKGYFLLGVPGISSYSDNFSKAIKWISSKVDNVFFFVPDFRIGNSGIRKNESFDGVFIEPNNINGDSDKKCYARGIDSLNDLSELKNIKFIFWCLSGRECLNKKNGKFIENGTYKHPIWNLDKLKEKYPSQYLDVSEMNIDIFMDTLDDGTIHPNTSGLDKLNHYFNEGSKND